MGDLPQIPATGKRIDVRGASILEFADERFRRVSDYWDMARFLEQLGVPS
jgi:predicted ester cyclase